MRIFCFVNRGYSQRLSDDRFLGGSYTEIILNNYGQHINDVTDGEIFEICVVIAKI